MCMTTIQFEYFLSLMDVSVKSIGSSIAELSTEYGTWLYYYVDGDFCTATGVLL